MVERSCTEAAQEALQRRVRAFGGKPAPANANNFRYHVTILSNQGGISLKTDTKGAKSDPKQLSDFKSKVGYVLAQLDFPISIYAATGKDQYRKPRAGMWQELLEAYDLKVQDELDLENSVFVGDAGGRLARDKLKADHSSSDRSIVCEREI